MSLLSALGMDKAREGTHYADRMTRILGACHQMGVLWHEEKLADGPHRYEDVRPIDKVILTPRYEKYGLRVNAKRLERIRGMAQQFAYALNVPTVSVEVDGDIVYVRVPREEDDGPLTLEKAWAICPDMPPGKLLLGAAEDGNQLCLDMSDPANVHCGVIGMTGSGKSTLMQTMIASALMIGGAQVALMHPLGKASEFWPLSGHPGVWRGGLYHRVAEIAQALAALRKHTGGRVFCFVDEVPSLVDDNSAIGGHLAALTQSGRHAGVHLILGAQRAAKYLDILDNVSARLVGRVADAGAAYWATSRRDSNAESLRGAGDFGAFTASGARHFQAAMPTADFLADWQRRYPPREGQPFDAPPPVTVPIEIHKPEPPKPVSVLEEELIGRGLDAIPRQVVHDIIRYRAKEQRWPSLHYCEQTYHIGKPKSRRAINLACLRLGAPLEYPHWRDDYKIDNLTMEVAGG